MKQDDLLNLHNLMWENTGKIEEENKIDAEKMNDETAEVKLSNSAIINKLNDNPLPSQSGLGNRLGTDDYENSVDTSDPRFILAGHSAREMLSDVVTSFRRYMDIKDVDPITNALSRMTGMIQSRIYFKPKIPYTRGAIIKLLTSYGNSSDPTMRRSLPGVSLIPIGRNDDSLLSGNIENLGIPSGNIDNFGGLGNIEMDKTQTENYMIQKEANMKIADLARTVTMDWINMWVFHKLPSYRLIRYVSGSLNVDRPESLTNYNLSHLIFLYWLKKNNDILTQFKMEAINNSMLRSFEDVEEFIENADFGDEDGADSIDKLINRDLQNPSETCDIIISTSILPAKEKAWVELLLILKELKKKNSNSKGFQLYNKYSSAISGNIPDLRIVLQPLPEGTTLTLFAEFSSLIALYKNKNKRSSSDRINTRFEITDTDMEEKILINSMYKKLTLMGF